MTCSHRLHPAHQMTFSPQFISHFLLSSLLVSQLFQPAFQVLLGPSLAPSGDLGAYLSILGLFESLLLVLYCFQSQIQ